MLYVFSVHDFDDSIMTATIIRLTNVIAISPSDSNELTAFDKTSLSANVSLLWRGNYLFVGKSQTSNNLVPALKNPQWIQNCLQVSTVKKVCLDARLSETAMKLWIDACNKTNKRVFIRVPPSKTYIQHQLSPSWRIKRLFDLALSAFILVSSSPLLLVLASLVLASSPGPVIYKQWRVGYRGEFFEIWKFRTMFTNAESLHHTVMGQQDGLHKLKDDPRITPIGRLMRKYSLDELPQIINVLRGEMSLVGPRPWAIYDAIRLKSDNLHRLRALPGITGSWQISGRSYVLDLNDVSQFDLEYLNSWSLWKDFQIMLMTIPKVLSGFGAY